MPYSSSVATVPSPPTYTTGNDRWELLWTSAATVLFVGLVFMGYTAWAEARFAEAATQPGSPDREVVEVTGQQFVWNIRYPGPDGKFGPLDVNLIDDSLGNPLGVDRGNPDGKGRHRGPAHGRARRQGDRSHPAHQGCAAQFPSCRSCGSSSTRCPASTAGFVSSRTKWARMKSHARSYAASGHYKMRSYLDVMEQADYEQWLVEQASFLQ